MVIIMNNLSSTKSLTNLEISNEIIKKLTNYNITTVNDLWQLKRNDLKQIGLTDKEVTHIIIKLQLHSMNLNRKTYNKN